MINEELTFNMFGYHSTDLTPNSGKKIVAVCDSCGTIRYPKRQSYRDLCNSCKITPEKRIEISMKLKGRYCGVDNPMYGVHRYGKENPMYGKKHSDKSKQKISDANKNMSAEARDKMSKNHPDISGKNNPFYGKNHSDENRQKMSAGHQGITYDEWESFVRDQPYCPQFNELCKESNREKYGRECFICGLPEAQNITTTKKQKKLSVHHVDMNKDQGCDGNRWKLIPVCLHCHGRLHNTITESYVTYILECEAITCKNLDNQQK